MEMNDMNDKNNKNDRPTNNVIASVEKTTNFNNTPNQPSNSFSQPSQAHEHQASKNQPKTQTQHPKQPKPQQTQQTHQTPNTQPRGGAPQTPYSYTPAYGYAYAPPPQTPIYHHHYYYEAPRPKKGRSSKPTIAGALLILTAILGLISGLVFISSGVMFSTADTEGFSFWNLPEEGDVYGRVTYLNGTGVSGATITIVDEDMITTTDNDGYYILYNVPSGNQELKVEKEGFQTFIKKIFVSPTEVDVNWQGNSNNNKNNHATSSDDTNSGSGENEHNFELSAGEGTIERGYYPPWGMISGFVYACGILIMVFSIIALLGGYFAIKRKKFGLAMAGAIVGIFTFGLFLGALFAIIALFILILARDEFRSKEETTTESKM